jgi:hypothetical protein
MFLNGDASKAHAEAWTPNDGKQIRTFLSASIGGLENPPSVCHPMPDDISWEE